MLLLWFSDRDDVAGTGGTAERSITTTGSGPQRPKHGDECSIFLEARLEETNEPLLVYGRPAVVGEEGDNHSRQNSFSYTVGSGGPGGVLPGLDTLLLAMRQNETCSFKLSGEQLALSAPVTGEAEHTPRIEQVQATLQATPGVARTPPVENWAEFATALPPGTAVVGELTLVTIGEHSHLTGA